MDLLGTDAKVTDTGTARRERPRTKLQLVYAIKDLLGITERGVLEIYEFEQMRKPSLIALYEALKVGRLQ
ncbi:MAG: hypothetical protein M1343_13260 [Chloroflexi bacterium]|nr:hypothetical protein [Chloroflexota bacterium]